jgi:hypothetical protein
VLRATFDDGIDPTLFTFERGGATVGTSDGRLRIDMSQSADTMGLVGVPAPMNHAEITVTLVNVPTVESTQAVLLVANDNNSANVLWVVQPEVVSARVEGGGLPNDAIDFPLIVDSDLRLRIATAPVAGGTQVLWQAALNDGGFTTLREEVVPATFSRAELLVLAFATPPTDPPPLHLDDFFVTDLGCAP